jgi:UPF0716 protein FxsA
MPLHYLVALFIGLPIIELALLFELHGIVGFVPTVLLVLVTGVGGATLVRRQGISILLKIQQELSIGNVPAPQMIDGVMILISGALLVTPGLITDVVGFLLLVPYVREKIRYWLKKQFEEKVRRNYMQVNVRDTHDFQ